MPQTRVLWGGSGVQVSGERRDWQDRLCWREACVGVLRELYRTLTLCCALEGITPLFPLSLFGDNAQKTLQSGRTPILLGVPAVPSTGQEFIITVAAEEKLQGRS